LYNSQCTKKPTTKELETTFVTSLHLANADEEELEELDIRLTDMLHDLADPVLPFDSQLSWYTSIFDEAFHLREEKLSETLSEMKACRENRANWMASLMKHSRKFSTTGGPFETYLASQGEPPPVEDEPTWDNFEIGQDELVLTSKLGSGAFGEVWKGFCRQKSVAVKTLKHIEYDPHVFQDLKREMMIMRQNSHQNILQPG